MGIKSRKGNYLVWMDLEMTGLDPKRCSILEIAVIITDNQLNIIAQGPCLAIHHSDKVLKSMEPWSRRHHAASGLTEACRQSKISQRTAERMVLDFIKSYCAKKKAVLCGNSIWQDRRFLVKYMPCLDGYLHYRMIDVSSVKELVQRWYHESFCHLKKKTHRSLMDIQESIEELRRYHERFFIPRG